MYRNIFETIFDKLKGLKIVPTTVEKELVEKYNISKEAADGLVNLSERSDEAWQKASNLNSMLIDLLDTSLGAKIFRLIISLFPSVLLPPAYS